MPGHGGCTMLQFFLGVDSGLSAGHPMKSEKQVNEAFEDHFRKVGAPIGMFSNYAKSEMHGRTKDLLRMYEVDDGQSEPTHQHQNPAKREFKTPSVI